MIEHRDEQGNLIASTEPRVITRETLIEQEAAAIARNMRPADARLWIGDTVFHTAGRPESEDYTTSTVVGVWRNEVTGELSYDLKHGGSCGNDAAKSLGEWQFSFYGPNWDGTPISSRFAPWTEPFMGNEAEYRAVQAERR